MTSGSKLKNLEAFDLILKMDQINNDDSNWNGLKTRAESCQNWIKKNKIKSDWKNFESLNVSTGIKISLIKNTSTEIFNSYGEILFRIRDMKTKYGELWHVEFVNFLTTGYDVYIDPQKKKIVLVRVFGFG